MSGLCWYAPPCDVDEAARATPKQAAHTLFAEAVDMARQAEIELVEGLRLKRAETESRKKNSFFGRSEA